MSTFWPADTPVIKAFLDTGNVQYRKDTAVHKKKKSLFITCTQVLSLCLWAIDFAYVYGTTVHRTGWIPIDQKERFLMDENINIKSFH